MDHRRSSNPKVKGFSLCDQCIQGVDGKHSVIGMFQAIHATQFPVFHHRFGIYLRLGEMRGSYTLAIRFVDPDDERILAEAKLEGIRRDKPLEDFEAGVNLPGLEIPRPGVFEVRLISNDELIHVDTLRAVMVEQGGPGLPNSPPFVDDFDHGEGPSFGLGEEEDES